MDIHGRGHSQCRSASPPPPKAPSTPGHCRPVSHSLSARSTYAAGFEVDRHQPHRVQSIGTRTKEIRKRCPGARGQHDGLGVAYPAQKSILCKYLQRACLRLCGGEAFLAPGPRRLSPGPCAPCGLRVMMVDAMAGRVFRLGRQASASSRLWVLARCSLDQRTTGRTYYVVLHSSLSTQRDLVSSPQVTTQCRRQPSPSRHEPGR